MTQALTLKPIGLSENYPIFHHQKNKTIEIALKIIESLARFTKLFPHNILNQITLLTTEKEEALQHLQIDLFNQIHKIFLQNTKILSGTIPVSDLMDKILLSQSLSPLLKLESTRLLLTGDAYDPSLDIFSIHLLIDSYLEYGNFKKASEMAQKIACSATRSIVLKMTVKLFVKKGQFELAKNVLRTIPEPLIQVETLIETAEYFIQIHQLFAAKMVVDSIDDQKLDDITIDLFKRLIALCKKTGDSKRVQRLNLELSNPRLTPLNTFSEFLGEMGRFEEMHGHETCKELARSGHFDSALSEASYIFSPKTHAKAISEIAFAYVDKDRPDLALRVVLEKTFHMNMIPEILKSLAIYTAIIDLNFCANILEAIEDPHIRAITLKGMAELYLKHDAPSKAEEIACSIEISNIRTMMILEICTYHNQHDNSERAAQLSSSLFEPESKEQETDLSQDQIDALNGNMPAVQMKDLAIELQRRGASAAAKRIAQAIKNPEIRTIAILALCEVLHQTGKADQANDLSQLIFEQRRDPEECRLM